MSEQQTRAVDEWIKDENNLARKVRENQEEWLDRLLAEIMTKFMSEEQQEKCLKWIVEHRE